MTLKSMLSSLRRTTKNLAKLDKEITKQDTVKPPPGAGPGYKQPISSFRVTLTSLINDAALASNRVSQYAAIISGSPLGFDPNQQDALSTEIDNFLDTDGTTMDGFASVWWRKGNAVKYGLEWYLRTEFEEAKAKEDVKMTDTGDDTDDNDIVTDLEILETFRAIGCMSFTDFEIAAHRAVWSVEEKVEAFRAEVEEGSGVKVEKSAENGDGDGVAAGIPLRNKCASYANKNTELKAEPQQGEKVYKWSAVKARDVVEMEKQNDPPVKKSLKVASQTQTKKRKRNSKK
jgi:hypothetical protein